MKRERFTLMARGCFKAPGSGGIGSGSGGGGDTLWRNQNSRPFSTSRRRTRRPSIATSWGDAVHHHQHLPLTAASRRHPRALHVCRAMIPTSLATSPAPPILTLLFCSVSTVPTHCHRPIPAVAFHLFVGAIISGSADQRIPFPKPKILGSLQILQTPTTLATIVSRLIGRGLRRRETRGCSEKGKNADANAESGGGR